MMNRGYLDLKRLYKLHQAGAFFATRAKRGMDERCACSTATGRTARLISDQTIHLNNSYFSKGYPEQLCRICVEEPASGKTLIFLTNNKALLPLSIAARYKSHWQVELFLKWIKQHLCIKRFLGASENAVKTQIWCVMSTYVLSANAKQKIHLDTSLHKLLQICQFRFSGKPVFQAPCNSIFPTLSHYLSDNPLTLIRFKFSGEPHVTNDH